ncbi:MAG: LysM peptidoglycan-binding domain-containing protein [bacterium]|nr:LysM peptidoglycan-binding domain-containing protein [bacterium]
MLITRFHIFIAFIGSIIFVIGVLNFYKSNRFKVVEEINPPIKDVEIPKIDEETEKKKIELLKAFEDIEKEYVNRNMDTKDLEYVYSLISSGELIKANEEILKLKEKLKKKIYIVKKGDSLWKISKNYYGYGSKWYDLWIRNKDKIRDFDLIYPAQEIVLP